MKHGDVREVHHTVRAYQQKVANHPYMIETGLSEGCRAHSSNDKMNCLNTPCLCSNGMNKMYIAQCSIGRQTVKTDEKEIYAEVYALSNAIEGV